ncbi:hypothetical protein NC652_011687 [Populus alba x Populus x berolinensis]|nr:hypothetical protein NC652_011687 [Populus alba x Populus x berolinensis]
MNMVSGINPTTIKAAQPCISLLGKNSAVNPAREMPIVAGTGLFRLASGYAIAQTYRLDVTTGDAIVGHQYTSTD